MNKINRSIQNIFIITLIIKILGLLYKILLTRILKLDGMVIYSLLTPVLALSICLSSYNIQVVCTQNVSEDKIKPIRNILKSAVKINLITSSIISLIILLCFPIFLFFYNDPLIYLPLLTIIPLIYFSNMSGIMKGYLEAKKDFTIPGISNLIESSVKIFLSILFLYLSRKENIYMQVFYAFLAMSLSEISSFLYLLFKIKKITTIRWSNTLDNQKLNIFKQATPLTLDHFIISIAAFLEPILFFYFANLANIDKNSATIMYTLCTQYAIPLLIIAAFVSQTLAKTLFPYIAKCQQDLSKIYDKLVLSFLITMAVSVINFNICNVHTTYILNLIYADSSSKQVVKLLSYFYYFSYYSPILVSILQASKNEMYLFKISLITNLLSLFITCSFLFFKPISIYSLPLSFGIVTLIKNILCYQYIKKHLNFKVSIFGFITLFTIFFQNLIISNLLQSSPLFNFVFSNLISLTLIVFYYYFFHKNKQNRYHMKHI